MNNPITQTKFCNGCEKHLFISDFYKGQSRCKDCKRVSSRNWARTPHGRKRKKNYKKSSKGRSVSADWRKRNKDKIRAHNVVNRAVRLGKIPHVSTLVCIICGKKAQHYHHFLGYGEAHFFDIVPCCGVCHAKIENC